MGVVECEGDDVVEHKVRVLQGDLPSPQLDDEMLDWREILPVLQTDTESKGLGLPRSSDDEILKQNS